MLEWSRDWTADFNFAHIIQCHIRKFPFILTLALLGFPVRSAGHIPGVPGIAWHRDWPCLCVAKCLYTHSLHVAGCGRVYRDRGHMYLNGSNVCKLQPLHYASLRDHISWHGGVVGTV